MDYLVIKNLVTESHFRNANVLNILVESSSEIILLITVYYKGIFNGYYFKIRIFQKHLIRIKQSHILQDH